MDSDRELRSEMRRALDAVLPPAPWLEATVNEAVRKQPRGGPIGRSGGRRLLSRPDGRLVALATLVVLALAAAGGFLAIHQRIGAVPGHSPTLKKLAGVFTKYTIPTANSLPGGIVTGPDGNLWFLEVAANKVAKVTTTGVFTEYAIPTAASGPAGIAVGPDGEIWFTESSSTANKVAKITTAGVFTEYPIPTPDASPVSITAGPDGDLWFTESTLAGKVAKVTTAGVFTEYPVPTANSGPTGIVAGPGGNLWFLEYYANIVGRVTTAGIFTEYQIPHPAGDFMMDPFGRPTSEPLKIAVGPDGNVWFYEGFPNKLVKVTTNGVFTAYSVPTMNSSLGVIAAGPDGNLWFTEASDSGKYEIVEVTASGVFMEYLVPKTGNGWPLGIAVGPDGNMWFTECYGNKVVMVTSPRA